jgi:hypothetical protein
MVLEEGSERANDLSRFPYAFAVEAEGLGF